MARRHSICPYAIRTHACSLLWPYVHYYGGRTGGSVGGSNWIFPENQRRPWRRDYSKRFVRINSREKRPRKTRFSLSMKQSSSGNGEADLKKSFSGENSRNGLGLEPQSPGTETNFNRKLFIVY